MSNQTPTESAPYLGRCKDCDYALFTAAEDIRSADNAQRGGPAVNIGNGQIMGRCPSGHRWFALRRIKGTYSADHKCDARCLEAKGWKCTCSCGGANHGRGHVATVTHTAPSHDKIGEHRGSSYVTGDREVIQAAREVVAINEPATEPQKRYLAALLDERELPANTVHSGDDRRKLALAKLDLAEDDPNGFTKKQASKTIEWLKSLPYREAV